MTAVHTPETLSARITLIGGEMQNWSDHDQDKGSGPFTSPLVVPMLRKLLDRTMSVLVVGPTAPWLLERIAEQVGSLDIVLRSSIDAQALNMRLNGKPVRIYCGGFDRFAGTPGQYDAVLALDGIPRAYSTDSVLVSWVETLGRLRDLAKPGGRLVLSAANGLGLDRILDAEVNLRQPLDDEWPTDAAVDAPPGLEAIRDAISTSGLSTTAEYAVYPRPGMPALMIRDQLLSGGPSDEVFSILASGTFAQTMGGRPVLADPSRLAREMMRHGTGLQLAPGWLFITTVGPYTDAELPDALMADNLDHPYWSVVTELAQGTDGRWQRSVVDVGRSATERISGQLVRDPSRLAGTLPTGTLLEELFLTACRFDDLNAMRKLVHGYAEWLRKQTEDGDLAVSGTALFATFENVMASDDQLTVFDPSWSTTLQVPFEVAFIRALRHFGFRILAAGLPHPWPSGMSPNRLTVTLAAMAGLVVTPALLEQTARLEVELDGQRRNNTEADDQNQYFELQTTGEQATSEPAQPRGYREALIAVGRLSTDLAAAQAQIGWLDETVQLRESQLRKERRLMGDLRGSVSYRIGQAITSPLRAILQLFRPAVRTITAKGK